MTTVQYCERTEGNWVQVFAPKTATIKAVHPAPWWGKKQDHNQYVMYTFTSNNMNYTWITHRYVIYTFTPLTLFHAFDLKRKQIRLRHLLLRKLSRCRTPYIGILTISGSINIMWWPKIRQNMLKFKNESTISISSVRYVSGREIGNLVPASYFCLKKISGKNNNSLAYAGCFEASRCCIHICIQRWL